MSQINYIGEQLIWGRLGNIFIAVSFASAVFSCILFAILSKNEPRFSYLKKTARTFFYVQATSVFGIFLLIIYLVFNHRFEYYYVWQHSSTIMPARYIFACIWEGQEGSFLLWALWHTVVAFFIIRRIRSWEAPVMSVIMMVQVFIFSMLLGIYIGDYKLGSNPFILLRENPQFANLPFVQMPDYLASIDGRGLNPLLQNYWMTIHPPTLFLGFALCVVPFAFALGGLYTGRITEWIKPALPYTFLGVMVLGTGILMGAAWAYEALSFGGFWAWDPVENASLVPWITLVGAGHVMLIYLKRQQALISVFILCIISFLLILYSTFLTRSGILGETSVHAFTDLGMSGQLLLYMLFFVVLSVVLFITNRKKIPKLPKEEDASSREFWMFIGMMVLTVSAIQITVTTSIPVINKVFNLKLAPPANAIQYYNSWQVPVAIVLTLLIAISQFFKFKKSDAKLVLRQLLLSFCLSLAISIAAGFILRFTLILHYLLLFSCVFAITANTDYFFRILKRKVSFSGASIAHAGLAMILLGALISNAKSHIISKNRLNVDLGKDFPNNENIMLSRNDTLPMGEFFVTYKGKHKEGVNVFYTIEYMKADKTNGTFKPLFTLQPIIQLNERMGNAAEPATKRYLWRDIYTHITYADLEEYKKENAGEYEKEISHTIAQGDTFTTSNSLIYLRGLDKNALHEISNPTAEDLAVYALLDVIDANKKVHEAKPVFMIKGKSIITKNFFLDSLGLKFRFVNINPDNGKITIEVAEKKSNRRDFIIMKAIIFPHINILWAGCLLLITGTWIAVRKRFVEWRKTLEK